MNGRPPVPEGSQLVPRDYPRVIVVSGRARGVDTAAQLRATQLRPLTDVEVIPANWSAGEMAGFHRNVDIVRRAMFLTAFWDGMSAGTVHSIVLARQKGISLTVYVGQQHLPTPSDESLPAAITRVYDELKRRRPSLPDYTPGPSETRLVLWTRQPEPERPAEAPKRATRRKASTKKQKETVGEH